MTSPDLFNLKNKVALITGASRGIGESIAHLLAAHGAHVILVGRKQRRLEPVEHAILEAGHQATAIPCHTGELEAIDALMEQVETQFGKLDILVNNAATNPFFGSVLEVDLAAWEKTMDVNLTGTFFLSQKAARLMIAHGGGAIVNVSSVNGVSPPPMQSVYSITKAGVIAMTKSFARELAPMNVRVNALLPGLTDTKFASAITQNESVLNTVLPLIPMKRIAHPNEMAGLVLYLVSDAASYTTGSCILVDGGMLA